MNDRCGLAARICRHGVNAGGGENVATHTRKDKVKRSKRAFKR